MKRDGITEADVVTTATDLEREGQRATTINVRARLGRGSLTTIQKHLEAWRVTRETNPRPPVPLLPDEFLRRWTRFAEEVWRAAGAEATKELDSVRIEAAHEIARARSGSEEATRVALALEREVEEAVAVREAADQLAQELRRQLGVAEATLAEVRASLTEERRTREAITTERDQLQMALRTAEADVAVERALAAQTSKREEDARRELATVRREIAEHQAEHAALKERLSAGYEHTISSLSQELESARLHAAEVDEELQATREELRNALTASTAADAALRELRRVTRLSGAPFGEVIQTS